MLSGVKFVQEKRLIGRFFEEVAQDTGKYVFSVKDTLMCLEMGAVVSSRFFDSSLGRSVFVFSLASRRRAQNSFLGSLHTPPDKSTSEHHHHHRQQQQQPLRRRSSAGRRSTATGTR